MSTSDPETRLRFAARIARQIQDAKGSLPCATHERFDGKLITVAPGDVLWMLTGRDVYPMLMLERGWTAQKYQDRLADTRVRSLLMLEKRR